VSDEQLEADTYVGLRDPLDSRHVIRVLSEPASPRVSLAAFGCLLLGGYAWIMSDRIRTDGTRGLRTIPPQGDLAKVRVASPLFPITVCSAYAKLIADQSHRDLHHKALIIVL
jgi:hypothetical protein